MTTTEKLAEKLQEFLTKLIEEEFDGDAAGVNLSLWTHENRGRVEVTTYNAGYRFTHGRGYALTKGNATVYVVPAAGERIDKGTLV